MNDPAPIVIAAFEDELRREWRIKRGVDYALIVKYGKVRLLCCDVFVRTITEVAAKRGIAFATIATYTNYLED